MKNSLIKIVVALNIVMVLFVATSCGFQKSSKDIIQAMSADIPLSEFVLGSWKTEHVYLPNGNESVFGFDVKFKDRDTIEVVVIENGEPTERTISQYSFISSDVIFVDNKRIEGGETWLLERDGQKLKVRLEINDGKEGITLILTRK